MNWHFFSVFWNLDKVLLLEIYLCDFQKVAGKSLININFVFNEYYMQSVFNEYMQSEYLKQYYCVHIPSVKQVMVIFVFGL